MAAGKQYNLDVVIGAVDRLTGPLRGMLSKVRAATAGMSSKMRAFGDRMGMPVISANLANVGRAFGKVSDGAGIARDRMLKLAGAATLAAGAVGFLFSGFADGASAISDLSAQTGASAERIQELNYAASQTGATAEDVAKSVQVFAKNVGLAAMGTGAAKDVFKGFGIQLRDGAGKMRSSDAIMGDFIDKLAKIKDPSIQAAAASRVLGKSSIALLPALKNGRAGLNEFSTEARRLGLIMSNESVAGGEAFGDAIDRTSSILSGMRNMIAGRLAPVLTKLADQFAEFYAANKDKIDAWAIAFAEKLPGAIVQLSTSLQQFYSDLKPVLDLVGTITDTFGAANTVIAIMAAWIGGPLILGIAQLALALQGLGLAFAMTPIGWFVLGIMAIVAAGVLLYQNWDKVSSVIGDSIDWIIKKVQALIDIMPDWMTGGVGFGMAANFMNPVGMLAGGAIGALGIKSAGGGAGAAQKNETLVKVDFANMPQGTKANTQTTGGARLDLNMGFATPSPQF